MVDLASTLKVLSDPTRLRILALLGQEELSVGELARAMAMAQSRVSNHLKVLREADMLGVRREGAFVHVSLSKGGGLPDDLWAALEPRFSSLEEGEDDRARLAQVLEARRRRSREFFDRVAPDWDVVGSDFLRGTARLHALATLVPRDLVVADVGCGTGYMARALVRAVDRVILVDHSENMLDQARRALGSGPTQVEFRAGELDNLPLADGEVDAVFAHMVMHHVPDMVAALRELLRVLKPGGVLVVTDLLPHKEAWLTEEMADLRLGLDPTDLARRAWQAGFHHVHTEDLEDALVAQAPGERRVELSLFQLTARSPSVDSPGRNRNRKRVPATPDTEGILP